MKRLVLSTVFALLVAQAQANNSTTCGTPICSFANSWIFQGQILQNLVTGQAATGSDITGAFLLNAQVNELTSVASGTGALVPPIQTISGLAATATLSIHNIGANALKIYPIAAQFNANISGTSLTVNSTVTGTQPIASGNTLFCAGVTGSPTLTGSGTTWTISVSQGTLTGVACASTSGRLYVEDGATGLLGVGVAFSLPVKSHASIECRSTLECYVRSP